METAEIRTRLEKFTADYDPAEHTRCLLDPFRDLLLQQRAKFMSYEQIAAALTACGLRTSREAVRCFCRRHFTKAQILRIRAQARLAKKDTPGQLPLPVVTPAPAPVPPGNPFENSGPRIARDNY